MSARPIRRTLGFLISSLPLFSFTNLLPISVLGAPFALYAVNSRRALSILTHIWPLPLLIALTTLSTLLYDPASFASFSFYRRDGNFFVTMAALVSGIVMVQAGSARMLLRLLTVLSLLAFAAGYPFDSNKLSANALFLAHNAAGGFYAAIALISLYVFRGRWRLILFCALCLAVFLTGSRGSILALFTTSCFAALGTGRRLRWLVFLGLLGLTLATAVEGHIKHYETTHAFYKVEYSPRAQRYFHANYEGSALLWGNSVNVFNRSAILWPRAIDLWLQAPLLGVGFGAYDDEHAPPENPAMILPDPVNHSDAHAHHSFLNVLAEQGAVGLLLVLLAFARIDRLLSRSSDPICRLGSLLIMLLLLMSLTEHRLYTPSNAIPVVYVIAFALTRLYHRGQIPRRLRPVTARAGPSSPHGGLTRP
ncbi:MAG: O-antigen ligase family protein [Vannielia sp.]|uniref:O-antigen ligase family protein n=1 Tax=Vannielia sp. TaxID=2813045 RepID=UPI003B8AEDB9